ncbi:predicted protein [Streptomyces sp. AA4]|nr:predicted protein [Streptomyces sp. AA4]
MAADRAASDRAAADRAAQGEHAATVERVAAAERVAAGERAAAAETERVEAAGRIEAAERAEAAEQAPAAERASAAERAPAAERATAAERAEAAERAVCARHLRRLWAIPGTVLGRSGWPPTLSQRFHWHWNYWWQAHLLDSLVDAQLRHPTDERARLINRFIATVHRRNFGSWVNDYYDDIAWLGLALHRVRQLQLSTVDEPIEAISKRLHEGWTTDLGGGIWWRRGDSFKNTPANGPAAIFHARTGDQERAAVMTQWLTDTLVDPETGLVWDGIRADTGELVKHVFSYCQGVYLGACLEQHRWDDAARTVRAVEKNLAPQGILPGSEGGDGGLFSAIAARYLALAAKNLPRPEAETAKRLVRQSAEACWNGATQEESGPLFSAYWEKPATNPPNKAERDLSVQIGGWMLLEAAATL